MVIRRASVRLSLAAACVAFVTACGARSTLYEPGDAATVSTTDGFAPDAAASDTGPVLHPPVNPCLLPGQWNAVASPTTEDLTDVFEIAREDVWIAGRNKVLFHFDGRSWNRVSTDAPDDIGKLWFASSADGWAVAGLWVLRWSGGQWRVVDPLNVPPPQILTGLWGADASDVWFGGGSVSPQREIVGRFDGESFVRDQHTQLDIQVVGFTGTARDDVWAVGDLGRLAHFDGTQWTRVALPDATETTINACASSRRNAVSCGANSGRIVEASVDVPARVIDVGNAAIHYAVWRASDTERWAVGSTGSAAHFVDGAWRAEALPTRYSMFAVHGQCATDGWAVGEHGTILRLTE